MRLFAVGNLHILACVVTAVWPKALADGEGGVFDPALIMEDVYESPRFQINLAEKPLRLSLLDDTLAKLRQRVPEDPVELAYDPVVLLAGSEWKFICQVPRVDTRAAQEKLKTRQQENITASEALLREMSREEQRQVVERGVELLDPLKASCLSYTSEYWTFEYCHNRYVRQYHRSAPGQSGRIVEVGYKLGEYTNRKQISAEEGSDVGTTKISTIGRKRFLTQMWGGGTMCDVTGRPRQVEVQFHCDLNSPEGVALVEEVFSCQYVVVIRTPRLCADPLFYNMAESAIHNISCQHVVPDEDYDRVLAALEQKESESINSLGIASDEAHSHDDTESAQSSIGDEAIKRKEEENKTDDEPQLVISMNDPRLAEITKGNEDLLRLLLSMAFGDPKLQIQFAENFDAPKQPTKEKKKTQKAKAKKDHEEL
ncbi:Protein OS-9 [Coemansia sp. RSA 1358]|nr:Protein OS-9 [Coemansia umbellata]KAJ2623937.1 Protein OS-9 [Coemansia sp. RSA 1358]